MYWKVARPPPAIGSPVAIEKSMLNRKKAYEAMRRPSMGWGVPAFVDLNQRRIGIACALGLANPKGVLAMSENI